MCGVNSLRKTLCRVRCVCDVHAGATLSDLKVLDLLRSGNTKTCRGYKTDQETGIHYLWKAHCASCLHKKRGDPLSLADFTRFSMEECAYPGCRAIPETRVYDDHGRLHEYKANSVDRIDARLGYIAGNIQTLCVEHNALKGYIDGLYTSDTHVMKKNMPSTFQEREAFMLWASGIYKDIENSGKP